jgi:hypothetical protein
MQIESESSFKGSGYGTEEEENTEKKTIFQRGIPVAMLGTLASKWSNFRMIIILWMSRVTTTTLKMTIKSNFLVKKRTN